MTLTLAMCMLVLFLECRLWGRLLMQGKILECQMEFLLMGKALTDITIRLSQMALNMKQLKSTQVTWLADSVFSFVLHAKWFNTMSHIVKRMISCSKLWTSFEVVHCVCFQPSYLWRCLRCMQSAQNNVDYTMLYGLLA